MAAKRKRINLIESLLAKLTEEGRQEFERFASCDRRLIDLQRWWAERGFTISVGACETWRTANYQAGKRAKELQAFIKDSQGLNSLSLLEYAVCEAAFAVREAREQLDENGYNPKDLLVLLSAIKELRSNAEYLNNAKIRGDRTQDILSGAYEVCRKVLTAAKDHPNEQWLEELLNGELKATEEELRKEQVGEY